jgi:UDP-glucuronate 4-epimerase
LRNAIIAAFPCIAAGLWAAAIFQLNQDILDRTNTRMIIVTGSAGFIGFHVSMALLNRGEEVIGVDNVNSYYDPSLKESRLELLRKKPGFRFYKTDICDYENISRIFKEHRPAKICHLAAQAGVRYSIENPFAYQKSNNEGFLCMIECARHFKAENFVFASTSSVYGLNEKLPFSETDNTDRPVSFYAATKKANETAAHTYSHLYGLPCSALRFFTVYGPWGRPDMALFLFTKAILEEKAINVFNHGRMKRNFTYIDDIVSGILLALDNPVPYEIYNIGNNKTVELMAFIREIEKNTGKEAVMNMMPMQAGDIEATEADISKLSKLGFSPATDIEDGIRKFVLWFRKYYGY